MSNRVTAITPQKKHRRRFNVYLDGEYAFSLAAKLAAAIRTEDVLSEQRIDALKTEDKIERAFDRALYYLKFRPRSTAEISRYLAGKNFGEKSIEAALQRLRHYDYIDDAAFADFWVESRKKRNPKGLFALRYELREKGIDKHLIENALSRYDELAPAWQAVSSKLAVWSKLPEFELKIKIFNFLKQRGFAIDTCDTIFARAAEQGTAEDER